jgi:hypothetical protein
MTHLSRKLNPARFPGMSPLMAANRLTDPQQLGSRCQ